MHSSKGLLIVGVGGTGVLKASEFIAQVLIGQGQEVCQSEVHGMAQRGGSVITHLRYGSQVYSPLLTEGEAEHMLAMEEMESLRYAHYLAQGATVLINRWQFLPPGFKKMNYPENILRLLEEKGFRVIPLPAADLAGKSGSLKATNTLMVGALSALMTGIPEEAWLEVLDTVFEGKSQALNRKTFQMGRQYVIDSLDSRN